MALFDTDILIDHLREKKGAKKTLRKFKNEQNYYSVITMGEILFGMREEEKNMTYKLLDRLTALSIDKEIPTVKVGEQETGKMKTLKGVKSIGG